jgi:fused signal recognition particle receptor
MIKKWLQRTKRTGQIQDERQPLEEKTENASEGEGLHHSAFPVEGEGLPPAGKNELEAETQKTRFGLFKRLKEQMEKTRGGFIRQMDQILLGKKKIDEELLERLEELLVTADMGVGTVQEIFERLREEVKRDELNDPGALRKRLREYITALLDISSPPLTWGPKPFVVLVVGVNGVGKTTTIAKLAHNLRQEGKEVLLVAADTFRAAAIEQLETWGKRLGVPVIKHKSGSDPSAVAYDGTEAALRRGVDVVIIDTAGRLHTKVNLMEELKKIRRVISKNIPAAPHEVLLVLDATTGQNAVSQARLFNEAAGITGIALTKLDGTAKGGIVVSIAHQMQIPIRFIGIGEKMEDLRRFDAEEFVEAIFSQE